MTSLKFSLALLAIVIYFALLGAITGVAPHFIIKFR